MLPWKRSFLIAVAALQLIACSPVEKSGLSGDSEEGSTGVDTSGSPLYFVLEGKPEGSGDDEYEELGSCVIAAGTTEGTAEDCDISVPELQLHYYDLKFKTGTASASTCAHVGFQPFYYLKSTSALFMDSGASATIDCSVASPPAGCYAGIAKEVVTAAGGTFPTSTGVYFVPSSTLTASWEVDSLNTLRTTNTTDYSYYSNANVTNGLVNRVAAHVYSAAEPVIFEGGTSNYHDYQVTCSDPWAEVLYQIDLTISDENDATSDYYAWE